MMNNRIFIVDQNNIIPLTIHQIKAIKSSISLLFKHKSNQWSIDSNQILLTPFSQLDSAFFWIKQRSHIIFGRNISIKLPQVLIQFKYFYQVPLQYQFNFLFIIIFLYKGLLKSFSRIIVIIKEYLIIQIFIQLYIQQEGKELAVGLKALLKEVNTKNLNDNQSKEIITQFFDKLNIDDKEIAIKYLDKNYPNYLELIQENNFNNQISKEKLEDFVSNLSQDPNLLVSYQNDVDKIKEKFDELTNLNEIKERQQIQFKKNCEIELLRVQNLFHNYNLKQDKKEQIEQFQNNLIVKQITKDDFDQCFDIMKKDLIQKNILFEFIFSDKLGTKKIDPKPIEEKEYQKYQKIFQEIIAQAHNLTNRNSITSHIRNINLEIELKWISKTDLDYYMKTKAKLDLSKFCENKDKKEAILQFLKYLKIFGYFFDTDKFDEFEDLVLVKNEKTILDYLIYQDISFNGNHQNISSELDFLDVLNLSLQTQTNVIKALEYENTINEFNKNQKYILKKKYIQNEKVKSYNKDYDYTFYNYIMDLKSEWKQIYAKIYNIVEQEYRDNQSQFHFSMIPTIMDKLKMYIDEFKYSFIKYGAILGDVGQGMLYNFAIFVIWRYLCNQKYLEYTKYEEDLSQLEQDRFNKFMADIKQNQCLQSTFNGKVIAQAIIDQSIIKSQTNLVKTAQQELDQLVQDPKMQSYYLINELDTKLFNQQEKQNSFSQTREYIDNPVNFIESEVNQRTKIIREQCIEQNSQKLRENVKNNLNLILQKLSFISEQAIQNLQAQEFFIQLDNPNDAPKLLYQIVMQYLIGTLTKEQLNTIQDKFKNIFSSSKDQCEIDETLLYHIDHKIYILSDFIVEFINTIKQQLNQINLLKISNKFIEQQIQQIRYNMIGCRQCCPTCKRKCDEDVNQNNHKHQCRNGHIIRGMTGITVDNKSSLYSCEDIKHDYLVKEFNSEATVYMSNIRLMFYDWHIPEKIDENNKEKFNVIWNNIGKDYCYQRGYKFIEKKHNFQEFQQIFHYIILLDDSGSMSGDRFNQAQNGLLGFLSSVQAKQNIIVTIIIFNSSARCVVDFQPINIQTIKNAVVCNGGGTSFQSAFQLAYEKIVAVKNGDQINKHILFFYTDGGDSFPTQALEQFARLPQEQRMKIDLIACCLDRQQKTMIDITDFFNRNCSYGKLQDSMEPSQIEGAWLNQAKRIVV